MRLLFKIHYLSILTLLLPCNAIVKVRIQQSSDLVSAIERAMQVKQEPIEAMKIIFSSRIGIEERPAMLERAFAELADKNLAEQILVIDLSQNYLTDVPNLHIFPHIQKLDLSYNHLTQVPADIYDLAHLQELDLLSNYLTDFTAWPHNSLQILTLASNQLTTIELLGNFPSLTSLYLSDNKLEEVPDISSLCHLKVLDLAKNMLELPPDLTPFHSLRLLDLEDNNLVSAVVVPLWLKRNLKIEGYNRIEYEHSS